LTGETDEHGKLSAGILTAGNYEMIVRLEGVFGSSFSISFSITDPGPDCKKELLVTRGVAGGCVLSVVNPKNYK
jgi:hypothetical protein